MENLDNIKSAARTLFLTTGLMLFVLGFCLKNDIYYNYAKFGIFILDLPFLFFAITYLLTSIKLRVQEYYSLLESFIVFFVLLFTGFMLFFHFAFPDLI